MHGLLLSTARLADRPYVDTIRSDALLRGLLLRVPRLQLIFDPPGPDAAGGIAASIRERPRMVSAATTEAGWEALGANREAHRSAFAVYPRPRGVAGLPVPVWEDECRQAVERALVRARAEGRGWAGTDDLFAALLDDPDNGASQFLRYNRVGLASARRQIPEVWPGGDLTPRVAPANFLKQCGALVDPALPGRVSPGLRSSCVGPPRGRGRASC